MRQRRRATLAAIENDECIAAQRANDGRRRSDDARLDRGIAAELCRVEGAARRRSLSLCGMIVVYDKKDPPHRGTD
jgi:hypothetical protein